MESVRHVLCDLEKILEDVVKHGEQEVDGKQPVKTEKSLGHWQRHCDMSVNMREGEVNLNWGFVFEQTTVLTAFINIATCLRSVSCLRLNTGVKKECELEHYVKSILTVTMNFHYI